MSADTYLEIKTRLESIKEEVTSIKYDWYHKFSDEQENELMNIVNDIHRELDTL